MAQLNELFDEVSGISYIVGHALISVLFHCDTGVQIVEIMLHILV